MTGPSRRAPGSLQRRRLLLVPLVLYALLIGGYWVLRYSALWVDTDTSSLTRYAEAVRTQATLVPPDRVYPNGIAFQSLSVLIAEITVIPLQLLQSTVYPLISVVALAVVAFAFYSQVARDRRTVTLAVLLLLFQADLLFVTLRGSHEKLDWPMVMVALMSLWLSFRASGRAVAAFVALFYLSVFALTSSSVFFASTFLVAVGISLLLGLVLMALQRRRFPVSPRLQRLGLVALSCSILIFIFMFYLYPASLSHFRTLSTVVEQTSVLLLGFEARGQPYDYVSATWTSPGIYLGLTLFTWLLVILSFLEWLRRGWQFLKGDRPLELPDDLDWLLYAGFAIQVALGIVVDLSGALAQNLQLRMFPAFTILAVAVLARGMARVVARVATSSRFQGRARRIALGLAAVAFAWFGAAALLKATDEPLLSNNWTFYAWSEKGAIHWVEGHLRSTEVWAGNHNRVVEASRFLYAGGWESDNLYESWAISIYTRYILSSEQERVRAARAGIALPSTLDWDRVYDNGDAELYRRPPRTPYQK